MDEATEPTTKIKTILKSITTPEGVFVHSGDLIEHLRKYPVCPSGCRSVIINGLLKWVADTVNNTNTS